MQNFLLSLLTLNKTAPVENVPVQNGPIFGQNGPYFNQSSVKMAPIYQCQILFLNKMKSNLISSLYHLKASPFYDTIHYILSSLVL